MKVEEKEKVQSPSMKQEEIVPYILLEQLLFLHIRVGFVAEQGQAAATILLTRFILKFSKKLKKMRSKSITVRYCYRSKNPVD